jgi:hypothetical protein
MSKVLKAMYPDRCTGCEMCVIEVQQQMKKLGLEGSLIRVFRKVDKTNKEKLIFSIELDPKVSKLDIESIKNICPQGVFSVEDE